MEARANFIGMDYMGKNPKLLRPEYRQVFCQKRAKTLIDPSSNREINRASIGNFFIPLANSREDHDDEDQEGNY